MAGQADPDPRRRRWLLPRPDRRAFGPPGREFSVGYPVTDAVRHAIATMPAWAWQVACNADRDLREHADVVEITGLLDLSRWTGTCSDMRVILRRELPHPGATLDAFEIRDGYRYQAFTTNTVAGSWRSWPTPRTRPRRGPDPDRQGHRTGAPARHQHINELWVELALIAADLLALSQSMLLTDQPDLHRAKPKTLRYRLLHTAAPHHPRQRRVFLCLAEHRPWALALARAFTAGGPAPA